MSEEAENLPVVVTDPHELPPDAEEGKDVIYLTVPEDIENHPVAQQYSPLADTYIQSVRALRITITKLCAKMPPNHVKIIRMIQAGDKTKTDIAKELGVSRVTVNRVWQSQNGMRLMSLLNTLEHTVDGPNKEQRLHMLWRIAVDNEKANPKESTKALAEINRMTGVTGNDKGGGPGSGGNITIVVQNNVLASGPLD